MGGTAGKDKLGILGKEGALGIFGKLGNEGSVGRSGIAGTEGTETGLIIGIDSDGRLRLGCLNPGILTTGKSPKVGNSGHFTALGILIGGTITNSGIGILAISTSLVFFGLVYFAITTSVAIIKKTSICLILLDLAAR
jgi:hypothetical protein